MIQKNNNSRDFANFLHYFASEVRFTLFERVLERIDSSEALTHVENSGAPEYRATQFASYIVKLSEALIRAYNKEIYTFEGTHWQRQEYSAVMAFLRQARQKAGLLYDRKAASAKFLKSTYEELSLLECPKPKRRVPSINLLNGTLEIYPGFVKLRDHTPSDFFTYVIPYEYIEGAQAPQFLRFLEDVLPEPEARSVLQEYSGLVLLPHGAYGLNPEKVLLLYGTGANGKSVFHKVLTSMVGDENVSHFTLSEITDERGHNRAAMEGKLLNYSSEAGSHELEKEIFKKMVSGEPVTARRLYGNPFTLTSYPRFVFNCNTLPAVEHTHAFFRRFIIIPFEKTIPVEKQDQGLAERIIKTELPGVLNWALEGLFRLIENNGRFTRSLLAEKALAQFKRDSSSVLLWLEEEGQELLANAGKMLFKDVYNAYKMYCIEAGLRALSSRKFSAELKQFADVYKSTGNKAYVSLHP
jgi:putative DNA primase/helicase